MALKYALVAREETVLCEYSNELGAFRSVSCGLLERIPSSSDRVSFPYDGNLYSFAVEAGFTFGVVGTESKKSMAFGFLEKVKPEFIREFGSRALDAGPGSLDAAFGSRLKYWMDYSNQHPEELAKIHNLQKKVDDARTVMLTNIEEVIRRGEKLQDLESKADQLAFEADQFKSTGVALRKKMWWQKGKWQIVTLICVLILIAVIVLIIYSLVKK